jgi:hypothetical protein
MIMLAGCSGGGEGSTSPASAGGSVPVVPTPSQAAATWNSVKQGDAGYANGLVFRPTSENALYARTDIGGAYRWDQTTMSWAPITDGVGFGAASSRFHGIESIALDPNDEQPVYIATGRYTFEVNGRIYVSNDRGSTWTHLDLPFSLRGNNPGRAMGELPIVDRNLPSTLLYGSRTAGL